MIEWQQRLLNKIIIRMDCNEFNDCERKMPPRDYPLAQVTKERTRRRQRRVEHFSQPKPRSNAIKINTNKLPGDFFSKSSLPKKVPSLKLHIPNDLSNAPHRPRKVESERAHISPDKTSFFGFFQDFEVATPSRKTNISKLYSQRKADTRNQAKREPMAAERRLTPTTYSIRNEILELFPSTLDSQTADIIVSSLRSKQLKMSPRKELFGIMKQSMTADVNSVNDPELQVFDKTNLRNPPLTKPRKNALRADHSNLSDLDTGKEGLLNVTFYHGKSICFPPITHK